MTSCCIGISGHVEKFTYLKSLLERSAKDSISGLSLSAANYNQAIEILKRRFGNKEKIVNCHMEALVSLEGVHSDSNLGPIRRLYDQIETHIRSLEAMGVAPETYGSLLCPILIKKLPSELKLNVSRKLPMEDWNVTKIMKIMLEEIEARERTEGIGSGERKRGKEQREISTGVTLFGSADEYCCYCKLNGHTARSCRKVSKIEDRKRILQQSGKCFLCLKRGHTSNRCRSGLNCMKCKGRHHESICGGGHGRQHSSQNPQPKPPLNPTAQPFQSKPSTTLYTKQDNQAILLQTAQAELLNPNNNRQLRANLILDSGSQKSYITRTLSKKLQLNVLGVKPVTILTFGSTEERHEKCDL